MLESRFEPLVHLATSGNQDFRDIDPWLAFYGYAMLSENAVHAYVMEGLLYCSELRYERCAGAEVELVGAALGFESPMGTLERSYSVTEGVVTVATTLDLERRVLGPDELAAFRRFLVNAVPQTRIWFRYRMPRPR